MDLLLRCLNRPTFAILGLASIMGAWVRHGQRCEIWCQLRHAVISIWSETVAIFGANSATCALWRSLPTTWLYSWVWWLKRDDCSSRDQLQRELLELVVLSNGFHWIGTQFSRKQKDLESGWGKLVYAAWLRQKDPVLALQQPCGQLTCCRFWHSYPRSLHQILRMTLWLSLCVGMGLWVYQSTLVTWSSSSKWTVAILK